MRRQTHQGPGILVSPIQCAACSQWVKVVQEGTDKDIGVLCPNHKNEITVLRNQKNNLENENRTLTSSSVPKNRELAELQAQIRALETELTEKEEAIGLKESKVNKLKKSLELVKNKLQQWTKLIKHD